MGKRNFRCIQYLKCIALNDRIIHKCVEKGFSMSSYGLIVGSEENHRNLSWDSGYSS
jgi:hypothetical protein